MSDILDEISAFQEQQQQQQRLSKVVDDGGEEELEDGTFAMLKRQLVTVNQIRQDLAKRELLIETLRRRCESLEQETSVIPDLTKRASQLDSTKRELETLAASLAKEQSERLQAEQSLEQLSEEKNKSNDLRKSLEGSREEAALLKSQLSACQSQLSKSKALVAALKAEAQTNEAALAKESRLRKTAERSLKALQNEATASSAEAATLSDAKLNSDRMVENLKASLAALKIEAQQWKGLYEDLEEGVRNFRTSTESSQQHMLMEISSLQDALSKAEAAQVRAEMARDATVGVINALGYTVDGIVAASPRARSSSSSSPPSMSFSLSPTVTAASVSSLSPLQTQEHLDHITNYRAELRASLRQLSRIDTSHLTPSLQNEFYKLVSFLTDVISDSLDVQEEATSLKGRLEVAGDAISNATGLLNTLEASLKDERATVESLQKTSRRMVDYVRNMWRECRQRYAGESRGENAEKESEDVVNEHSGDAFDDLLPPLHNIFSLVTRSTLAAQTLVLRHSDSQSQVDTLLQQLDSTRASCEQQLKHAALEHQSRLEAVKKEHETRLEGLECELQAREEHFQKQLTTQRGAILSAYKEELVEIQRDMERGFNDKIQEIVIEMAQREEGRDEDRHRVSVYKSVCSILCAELAQLRQERELWGGKRGGVYGSVMRQLYQSMHRGQEMVAAIGAACDIVHEEGRGLQHTFCLDVYACSARVRVVLPSLRVVAIFVIAALRMKKILQTFRDVEGKRIMHRSSAHEKSKQAGPVAEVDVLSGSVDDVVARMLQAHSLPPGLRRAAPSLLQRLACACPASGRKRREIVPLPTSLLRHVQSLSLSPQSQSQSQSQSNVSRPLSSAMPAPSDAVGRLERTVVGLQRQVNELQSQHSRLQTLTVSLQEEDSKRGAIVALAQEKMDAYGQTVDLLARQSNERAQSVLRVALAHSKLPVAASPLSPAPAKPASPVKSSSSPSALASGMMLASPVRTSGYLTSPQESPTLREVALSRVRESPEMLQASNAVDRVVNPVVRTMLAAANSATQAATARSPSVAHTDDPRTSGQHSPQSATTSFSGPGAVSSDLLRLYQDVGRVDEYRALLSRHQQSTLQGLHFPYPTSVPIPVPVPVPVPVPASVPAEAPCPKPPALILSTAKKGSTSGKLSSDGERKTSKASKISKASKASKTSKAT